ncbi:fatty acid desaturase [Streptomyces sp. TE12347]
MLAVVTISRRPDRAVRRTVLVLGAAGLTVIATGAILDALWLLGIGVWALIAAMVIELVYRP